MSIVSKEEMTALELSIEDAARTIDGLLTVYMEMKLPISASIAYRVIAKLIEEMTALGAAKHYCCSAEPEEGNTVIYPVFFFPVSVVSRLDEKTFVGGVADALSCSFESQGCDYRNWTGNIPILTTHSNDAKKIMKVIERVFSKDLEKQTYDSLLHISEKYPTVYDTIKVILIKTSFDVDVTHIQLFDQVVSATDAPAEFSVLPFGPRVFGVVGICAKKDEADMIHYVNATWIGFVGRMVGATPIEFPVEGQDGFITIDALGWVKKEEFDQLSSEERTSALIHALSLLREKVLEQDSLA